MAIRSLKSGTFSRSGLVGNPVIMPGSYESIATVDVGSGGASSVTFSSIPSTYTHLQIRAIAQTNRTTSAQDSGKVVFNSDTGGSSYGSHFLTGDGASATASNSISNAFMYIARFGTTNSTNIFGTIVIDILDYTNTNKYKTIRYLGATEQNGSGYIELGSGLYSSSTSAITNINIAPVTGTLWRQYSSFALYGVN
jgi:hypothetical protein